MVLLTSTTKLQKNFNDTVHRIVEIRPAVSLQLVEVHVAGHLSRVGRSPKSSAFPGGRSHLRETGMQRRLLLADLGGGGVVLGTKDHDELYVLQISVRDAFA